MGGRSRPTSGTPRGHPVPLPLVSTNQRPVQYRGEDLDPERGPGLGCFRFQLVVLAIFVVLTPLTVAWSWPIWISTVLLFAVIVLLLVAGQTVIFLLRLVAADRRGRRRPLGSATKTVGELADAAGETAVLDAAPPAVGAAAADELGTPSDSGPDAGDPPSDEGRVRQ